LVQKLTLDQLKDIQPIDFKRERITAVPGMAAAILKEPRRLGEG
jgi:hypothetical protein